MHALAQVLLRRLGAVDRGGRPVPVSRANGNALFLEEMVGCSSSTGALREQDGRVAPSPTRPGAATCRQTIRLLIAARLDTLPPTQKELLQDASVCGHRSTWDGLLAEVSHVADRRAALRGLVGRGLLRRNPRSSVSRHERVRVEARAHP